jgi:hypothetical protein
MGDLHLNHAKQYEVKFIHQVESQWFRGIKVIVFEANGIVFVNTGQSCKIMHALLVDFLDLLDGCSRLYIWSRQRKAYS